MRRYKNFFLYLVYKDADNIEYIGVLSNFFPIAKHYPKLLNKIGVLENSYMDTTFSMGADTSSSDTTVISIKNRHQMSNKEFKNAFDKAVKATFNK